MNFITYLEKMVFHTTQGQIVLVKRDKAIKERKNKNILTFNVIS